MSWHFYGCACGCYLPCTVAFWIGRFEFVERHRLFVQRNQSETALLLGVIWERHRRCPTATVAELVESRGKKWLMATIESWLWRYMAVQAGGWAWLLGRGKINDEGGSPSLANVKPGSENPASWLTGMGEPSGDWALDLPSIQARAHIVAPGTVSLSLTPTILPSIPPLAIPQNTHILYDGHTSLIIIVNNNP